MRRLLYSLLLLNLSLLRAQELSVKTPIRYLALGDSYTIGQSVSYDQRWPRQLFDSLKSRGYNTDTIHFIAQTGWRTDNLQSEINKQKPDSNYNLVSLLIGVNNQYQGFPLEKYKTEFPVLLDHAIALAQGNKEQVFVVSIPDYAYSSFGGGRTAISDKLKQYDDFAKAQCDSLGIKFYYIGDISKQGLAKPDLVASDGLHPSGKQYTLYVERILNSTNPLALEYFSNPQIRFATIWNIGDTIDLSENIVKWELYSLEGKLLNKDNLPSVFVESPSGFYILKCKNKDKKIASYRIKIN
jgi:lysophospholipase L1-like esterase